MKQLIFTITDQLITRTDRLRVIADSIGQYEASFTVDDSWDGYIATVQYTKNGVTYDEDIVDGVADVPDEVLVGAGQMHVHVVGNSPDGKRITVNDLLVQVDPSGWRPKSSISASPIITIWHKVIAMLLFLRGGLTDQILRKKSDAPYDGDWVTLPIDVDATYHTEDEVDALLASKSDTNHTHDDRYYTEDDIDTKLGDIKAIGTITEAFTPIESLSSGVYTLDGTGGTLMIGGSGETIDYGTVIISTDLDGGTINWIAVGRDYSWNYGVFLGQSVRTGEYWEPTYQIIPNFGELSETIGGKQMKTLYFSDITVSDWDADETYADYSYRASVALTDVDITMLPDVTYDVAEAASGNYAQVCTAYSGGVYIYAKRDDEITIPSIKCEVTQS